MKWSELMSWFFDFYSWAKARKKHNEKEKALLCLKQALLLENYEKCKNLIAIAHEYGAENREIRRVIQDFFRHSKGIIEARRGSMKY